jgi:hypothetical protein
MVTLVDGHKYMYGPMTDTIVDRQEEQFFKRARQIVGAPDGNWPWYVIRPSFDRLITEHTLDLFAAWQARLSMGYYQKDLEDCLARCFESVVVAARMDGYQITKHTIGVGKDFMWTPREIRYTLEGNRSV